MENRNGLIVDIVVGEANGTAEIDAALTMLKKVAGGQRITVGGDKGFDTKRFVEESRKLNATPHLAKNESTRRTSNLDDRTTRHPGYAISQRIRMRIEEIFGWMKSATRQGWSVGMEVNDLKKYGLSSSGCKTRPINA